MPTLTALTESTKTAAALAETVGQEGLYPSLTTYPKLTQYPLPRVAPTLAVLTEV